MTTQDTTNHDGFKHINDVVIGYFVGFGREMVPIRYGETKGDCDDA